jgi:hypothetical protein
MSDNPLVATMKKYHIPLTRQNYLHVNGMGKPKQLGPEEEADLPPFAQLSYPTHEEQAAEKEKAEAKDDE